MATEGTSQDILLPGQRPDSPPLRCSQGSTAATELASSQGSTIESSPASVEISEHTPAAWSDFIVSSICQVSTPEFLNT